MTQFDADAYFNSTVTPGLSTDISAKQRSVIEASKTKLLDLETKLVAARQARVEDEARKEANKASFVGQLGVDPDSALGRLTNLAAAAVYGTARGAGHVMALPANIMADGDTSSMADYEIQAFNRHTAGQATDEDYEILGRKKSMNMPPVGTPHDTPENRAAAQAQADTDPNGRTVLEVLNHTIRNRERAAEVVQHMDRSSVLHKDKRDILQEQAGEGFESNWAKTKSVFGSGNKSNYMFSDKTPGLVANGNIPIAGKEFKPGDMEWVTTDKGSVLVPQGGKEQFLKDGKHFGVFENDMAAIGYLQQLNGMAMGSKEQKLVGGPAVATTSKLDRAVESVDGAVSLLAHVLKTGWNNPQASAEYIAENLPQLVVGGTMGKTGKALLGAMNGGYAHDQYNQGIIAYQASHKGALPPESVRQEMGLKAASLALAEQLGDVAQIKGMMGAGKAAAAGAKIGAGKAAANILAATAEGALTEGATEGYQTFIEGELTKYNNDGTIKGNSAKENYVGATIGALAGGGITGGGRALGEVANATPEHAEIKKADAATRQKFREAAEANDPSIYLDPKDQANYDPSKGVGVLLRHAQLPDTAPEVKEANLRQAGKLMSKLQEERDTVQERADSYTQENIEHIHAKIAHVQEQMNAMDPANTDQLAAAKELITSYNEELTEASDTKAALAANTQLSRLDRQLRNGHDLLEGMANEAQPSMNDVEVASLVDEVSGIPPVSSEAGVDLTAGVPVPAGERLINLSMAQPGALSSDIATKLAEDKSNDLTAAQRAHLRVFSEARIAENALSTLGKVANEVLNGSAKNVGIAQYRARIAAAIKSSTVKVAEQQLKQLGAFAVDHASKAAAATAALAMGPGAQVVALKGKKGWQAIPSAKSFDGTTMIKNGGLTIYPGDKSEAIVASIQAESKALTAANKEMASAVKNKFGVSADQAVQSSPSQKQTVPANNNLPQENVEESARPEQSPGEKGSSSLPKEDKKTTVESKRDAEIARRKAIKDAAATSPSSEPASLAVAGAPAATAPSSATAAETVKEDQQAEAKQPAVVSEANPAPAAAAEPAVEAVAEVGPTDGTYQQKKLGDFFTQVGAGQNPLASVKDFLSQVLAKTTSFAKYMPGGQLIEKQQIAALKAFRVVASAWQAVITANLAKPQNPEFNFNDLMQHFTRPDGDIEENVKTALAYAGFSYTAETAGSYPNNTNEQINKLLHRDKDAEVYADERADMRNVLGRRSAVITNLGKRAVAALGLEPKAGVPLNVQTQLENAMGAHALRLLIEGQGGKPSMFVVKTIDGARIKEMGQRGEMTDEQATSLEQPVWNDEAVFIEVRRDEEGNLTADAQFIVESNRGSQSALNKLFGVPDATVPPTFTPVATLRRTLKRSKQLVPKVLNKILQQLNNQENFLRADKITLLEQLGDEAFLKLMGWVGIDAKTMHADNREATEAKNAGLERELANMKEFIELAKGQPGGIDAPFFFEHYAASQQRVMIVNNMVNPQSSKLHRFMVYRPDWKTSIDMTSDIQMDNFWLRAAEGMGIKTDKANKAMALELMDAMYASPEVQAALHALNKAIHTGEQLSTEERTAIEKATAKGGEKSHTLDTLTALAAYMKAQLEGETKFDVNMLAEVDGVTNGPMLSHLLMGAAATVPALFELLNRGGFFQVGTERNYNVWRAGPNRMDLYEKTAHGVITNLAKLVRAGKVSGADVDAVTMFMGKLTDDIGKIAKDGRNMIKTPLTALMFGSALKKAIEDGMAGDFIASIRDKIEKLAKMEDGAAKEAKRVKMVRALGNLGFELSADTTVQEMLDYSFTKKDVRRLTEIFAETYGKAMEVTVKEDFSVLLTNRRKFNKVADITFDVANAAYNALRADYVTELTTKGELAATKNGDPIHDLNTQQEAELAKRVASFMPSLQTAMSNLSNEKASDTGMKVGKNKLAMDMSRAYKNEAHFGNAKTILTHGSRTIGEAPGVSLSATSTHSFDSAISHMAMLAGDKVRQVLNLHDAHGVGVHQVVDAGAAMNRAVWENAMDYSPAQEMYESMIRSLDGMKELLENPDTPAAVLTSIVSALQAQSNKSAEWNAETKRRSAPISPLAILSVRAKEAKTLAYEADQIKFGALAQMGSIAQYAVEGGNFEVNQKMRDAAQAKLDALTPDMSAEDQAIVAAVEAKLAALIKAGMGNAETMTGTAEDTFGPLGEATVQSDAKLVKFFEQNPVRTVRDVVQMLRTQKLGDFEAKLLSQLMATLGNEKDSILVKFITAKSSKADVLAPNKDTARAWFVSKGSESALYVLAPEFASSGLTVETLLHELTHAALARTMEQAQRDGKGRAFELVAELELLRAKAITYVATQPYGDRFDAALSNVHEFVSWGMTNTEFQARVLNRIEHASTTTQNKLVAGMQAFINTVTALLFGRPNVNMANGMAVLVQNVSGLLAVPSEAQADVNLSQTNNPNAGINDMAAVEIFDALEQNNNGATVSHTFAEHLRDIMTGFVQRLYGPAGSFKAALMEQVNMTPEAVYAQAMATGGLPQGFSGLAAGFAWTHQEAFVAEQINATFRAALENKSGMVSIAYRELGKLYAEVRAQIKVADLVPGKPARPSATQLATAKQLHDYLFAVTQDADGRSDYLVRFATVGLAHEGVNAILKTLATSRANRDLTGLSFAERLHKIFEAIMDFFAGKMLQTVQGQSADSRLVALVTQLARIEERKRAAVMVRNDVLGPIENGVNTLGQSARAKLEAFGKLPFFKNNTNGMVRLAGSMTSAFAGDRFDAMMEGFNKMRDQHFRTQQGVAAALVSEFRGAHEGNVVFFFLLRATKHLEGIRKAMMSNTSKVILRSFANNGADLSKEHKKAISAVFLRADLSSLLGPYTIDQIEAFVSQPAAVIKEIVKIERLLAGHNLGADVTTYFSNAAKALAFYKVTGKVRAANVVMNAGNIARLFGTQSVRRVTESQALAAEPLIDQLVSLYALTYQTSEHPEHMGAAAAVIAAERARTDGGNGVDLLLRTHKELQAKSKELLFKDAAALQMKGYTPETYDPYMQIQVANAVDGQLLMAQGYEQGVVVKQDQANPEEAHHIYHLRDGGLQRRVSGIISTTALKAKGDRAHNGNMSLLSSNGQMNAIKMASIGKRKAKAVAAMFKDPGFDPRKVDDAHMAPVLNANGDVVNYRYLMEEQTKDDLLFRDNRPENILGTLAGSIFDKVSSVEQNRKGIAALHAQYQQEFAERPESYMIVGPTSTDPQLREIWRLLPESSKQAVKQIWGTEGMKVRVDLLDMNFGYRKLSVADAFNKAEVERNFVEKMFVQIMRNMFDEKAGLRVRQAEDIWQEVVKATKSNLVVKSFSTLSGNFRSNLSQLLLMGVSPAKILEHHRVAYRGAWDFKKDSEALFDLKHQVTTGYLQPGETLAEVKHKIVVLEDAISKNPIKPLIDAGLMPTIVEDIDTEDDIYSYKSQFVKKTEKLTNKVNPHVLNVGKELLMLEGSRIHAVMSHATQISDFLARYTLYQVKVAGGMSHLDAVQLASDAFINYDVPTHRMVQYANDSGLVMFTKYYMRIQKMLVRIYKENPGRAMAMMAAEAMIGDQPTVLDSSMLTRWGNPLNFGALDYPGSLDQLTTVRVLTSPFRSGNPAE